MRHPAQDAQHREDNVYRGYRQSQAERDPRPRSSGAGSCHSSRIIAARILPVYLCREDYRDDARGKAAEESSEDRPDQVVRWLGVVRRRRAGAAWQGRCRPCRRLALLCLKRLAALPAYCARWEVARLAVRARNSVRCLAQKELLPYSILPCILLGDRRFLPMPLE